MTATKLTPTGVLIDLVTALIAPMFLMASNGDINLARDAAVATMSAYRVQHQADLLTVAQIVAFGLATLGSLGLSMGDDLSLSMVLRLRGNANTCNRSAEQLRRALQASNEATQSAPTASDQPQPAAAPSTAAKPQPTAKPPQPVTPQPVTPQPAPPQPTPPITDDQRRRAAWAAAFTEVAAEYEAELPNLPPAEQKAASIRASALNSSASALLSGVDLSPFAPNRLPKPPAGG